MLIQGFTTAFDLGVPTRHWFAYAPDLDWSTYATNKLLPYVAATGSKLYHQFYEPTAATFAAAGVLAVSALIAWICACVHDQRSIK
jgi:hypothetical protein